MILVLLEDLVDMFGWHDVAALFPWAVFWTWCCAALAALIGCVVVVGPVQPGRNQQDWSKEWLVNRTRALGVIGALLGLCFAVIAIVCSSHKLCEVGTRAGGWNSLVCGLLVELSVGVVGVVGGEGEGVGAGVDGGDGGVWVGLVDGVWGVWKRSEALVMVLAVDMGSFRVSRAFRHHSEKVQEG